MSDFPQITDKIPKYVLEEYDMGSRMSLNKYSTITRRTHFRHDKEVTRKR